MAYQLTNTESVPQGIKRVVCEEIESAINELTDQEIDSHEGVHQARKRFKKIRAILRLTREELGEVYTQESLRFRDFGRKLSAIRDAEAMIETFDKLQQRFKDQLGSDTAAEVKDNLVKRCQIVAHEEEGLAQRTAEVVAELRNARELANFWPLNNDDFSALRPGLQKIYRGGRKRFAMAYQHPTADNFHEWRKRVKDLWYYNRLLQDLWPVLMDGYIESLHQLSEYLGDDHDLVVFKQLLIDQPEKIGSEQTVQILKTLVDKRQGELRANAEKIAPRIYAEKPANFCARIEAYWQVWKAEKPAAV
ncbi:MAG: CHAD domain-containing protein [Gammaproteobacteria bacterium]|nr:CHAD domain-containing protein [Gammaproteobacteria bacterium]